MAFSAGGEAFPSRNVCLYQSKNAELLTINVHTTTRVPPISERIKVAIIGCINISNIISSMKKHTNSKANKESCDQNPLPNLSKTLKQKQSIKCENFHFS